MNRALLARYWPFAALVALQVLLVTLSGDGGQVATTEFSVGDGSGSASGQFSGGGQFSGQNGASGATSGATGTNGGAIGSRGSTGASGGGQGAASGGGGGAGQVPGDSSQASGGGAGNAPDAVQTLDSMGRPLDGDRSKCGKDAVLQEDITLQSPPCMPRFAGNNGGATYQGVDAETIRVVIYYPEYAQGTQQVLAANGLAMTPAQAEELHALLAQFFNAHYEFHGRSLELITHMSPAADAIALRAEAKAVVQKHHPFAVLFYGQGLMPPVMADQLARDGVVSVGVSPVADDFFVDRAPMVWSQAVQGYRLADMAADFYCKRMHGKLASLAGDPALRVQPRKLGVGASEDPNERKTSERFVAQVTGGMCGSSADSVTTYMYSSDPDTAENQLPALVSRMKSDGITTTFRINVCAEGDRQGYFPENYRVDAFDDDFVGRVYGALCSPTQMQNAFGLGLYPKARPKEEKEFYTAIQTVNPDYDAAYLSEGAFNGVAFFSRLVQYAGPNLNPQSLYEGSRSMPQIAGWSIPAPWPGWHCCDPFAPEYHVAISPDSFTAKVDTRQIYWDNAARSDGDGATGAWVGVDDSRRYEVGQWTTGEPKQP